MSDRIQVGMGIDVSMLVGACNRYSRMSSNLDAAWTLLAMISEAEGGVIANTTRQLF